MKTRWIFCALLCGALTGLGAEITSANTLTLTVSSLPEAKLDNTQSWTFPVLRGDHFLTRDNSFKLALDFYVTPVSVFEGIDLTLTPAAFAQIRAGGSVASGWNVPGLAPHAWGINEPSAPPAGTARSGLVDGAPFEALVWKVYGGAVLQFDLAAVLPGDWTHLQFQTHQQIFYRANTLAAAGEPWSIENDGGENQNGFKYYAAYTLAYALPAISPVLRIIAIQAELEWKLYDTPGGEDYGDNLPWGIFSGIANFGITPRCSFTAIVQLSLDRNFENWRRRIDEGGAVFYRDRILFDDKPLALNFYRFAAIFSFKIH